MRIGRLDRRIKLLARSVNRDGFGGASEQFTEIAEVFAGFIPDRGGELSRTNDAQRQTQLTVTFRVRWRDDLNTVMRVQFDGADYDVKAVLPIGRHVGADLQAVASVS
jgi:SPP1 family predicted phage head-tail adaptor